MKLSPGEDSVNRLSGESSISGQHTGPAKFKVIAFPRHKYHFVHL